MYSRIKHQSEFEHVVFLKGASFTSETLFAQTQRANMYGPTRGNIGRMPTATPFAFLTSSDQNSPRSLGSGSPCTPSVQAHTAPSFNFGAQNGNMNSAQYQHGATSQEAGELQDLRDLQKLVVALPKYRSTAPLDKLRWMMTSKLIDKLPCLLKHDGAAMASTSSHG